MKRLAVFVMIASIGACLCGKRRSRDAQIDYTYLVDADGGTIGLFVPAGFEIRFVDSGLLCVDTTIDGTRKCTGWYADFVRVDGGSSSEASQ